ncbi:MAG: hypothetical protein QNJ34_19420 [Xenococcaceae cyanobacterium MO_188.B29]|nr:hypothetical protein [Xenococcaceae cyanobacterium MO_188.B29]
MATSTSKSARIVVLTPEEHITLKSEQEVLLLLQHLAKSQEVTVKLILDRLYDLGALNIIKNKLRSRILKGTVKGLAQLSKPAFRVIGFYWFKQNCPQLIADWLVEQVTFSKTEENATEILEASANSLQTSESNNPKIKKLRSQVRLLTVILITVITIFGGSFAWLFYSLKVQPSSLQQPKETHSTLTEK